MFIAAPAPGTIPAYKAAAAKLGRDMAEAEIGLVYGGGGNGLMGTVAAAVLDRGGHVTGIIPASLLELENALGNISERYVTNGFHERKMLMFNLSDGFVALPGGVGTLEELVEQLTWAQLGHHDKPIFIVNTRRLLEPAPAALRQYARAALHPARLGICPISWWTMRKTWCPNS